LGFAAFLVLRRGWTVLATVAGVGAVVRVSLLLAAHPLLPVSTEMEFRGVVVGIRTDPYTTVQLVDPPHQRLRIRSPLDRPLHPGDLVSGSCFTGRLPGPAERWRLAGVVGGCFRQSLERVESGSTAGRSLAGIRAATAARIRSLYPEPASDFLEGILVGAPQSGSIELTAILRTAGVSHLVAVSGYNLTVLVSVLATVVLPLAGRRIGSGLLALGLVVFAGISGFEPSVLRAGAMAGLLLVAYLVGRPAALPRLLAFSVLVLVWAAPGLLLFDLGFQLSVAATAGIAFLAEPLERYIGLVPEGLRRALTASLAAVAATAPVLLVTVGRVSLMAPFTTAVLSPLIPPAMGLGTVSILLSVFSAELATPVAAVEQALLDAMLWVARTAAGVPFASVTIP
jgi:competence protein ComEC